MKRILVVLLVVGLLMGVCCNIVADETDEAGDPSLSDGGGDGGGGVPGPAPCGGGGGSGGGGGIPD